MLNLRLSAHSYYWTTRHYDADEQRMVRDALKVSVYVPA